MSNLFSLLITPALLQIYRFDATKKEVKHMLLWVLEEGFCYIFKDIPFNIAHLNFAFEYYRIAKFIPFVLTEH